MKSNDRKPVLITLGACAKYLDISIPTVSKYIKIYGMPCWLEGRTWHFHKDRINEWFFNRCNCKYEGDTDPMDVEGKNSPVK